MEYHIDEMVSAYIDNELSAEDLQLVKKHLESCEQCNQMVEELLHIQSGIMRVFHNIHIPDGVENKVLVQLNSNSPVKFGFFTLAIPLVFIIAVVYFLGSFVLKTISLITKILMGITYTGTQFMGSQPMTRMSVFLFAIILLVISGFALHRLLQFNNAEGDESFG